MNGHMSVFRSILLLLPALALSAQTPEQLEFFEKNIRPVLAERCYACHSADTMAAAELRLDTRQAVLKGGTRGTAVAPGSPDSSVLMKAISYMDVDLRMPPDGKLDDDQIANFRAWIEMGAPDPREDKAAAPAPVETSGIDWDEERKFWSFQPIADPAVPAQDETWAANDLDRFLLAVFDVVVYHPLKIINIINIRVCQPIDPRIDIPRYRDVNKEKRSIAPLTDYAFYLIAGYHKILGTG